MEETAKRISNAGFYTVQLDIEFKDMDLTADNITKKKINTIRDVFRRRNLPISCISGYNSLVHPNTTKRKTNLYHLKQIIKERWKRRAGSNLPDGRQVRSLAHNHFVKVVFFMPLTQY